MTSISDTEVPRATGPHLEGMSIIVPVSDMTAAVEFYRDILQFELRFLREDGNFALLARDHAAVSLVTGATGQIENISAYVWVSDIDSLYDKLHPGLDSPPPTRLRKPFDQSYGMREFHVKDPDGTLWFFGMNTDSR